MRIRHCKFTDELRYPKRRVNPSAIPSVDLYLSPAVPADAFSSQQLYPFVPVDDTIQLYPAVHFHSAPSSFIHSSQSTIPSNCTQPYIFIQLPAALSIRPSRRIQLSNSFLLTCTQPCSTSRSQLILQPFVPADSHLSQPTAICPSRRTPAPI